MISHALTNEDLMARIATIFAFIAKCHHHLFVLDEVNAWLIDPGNHSKEIKNTKHDGLGVWWKLR